jgi:CheY-like chemotaxis protein
MTNTEKVKKVWKILVIEDEPLYYTRQFRKLEKKLVCSLSKAIDLDSVRNCLEQNEYDLIIIDVMMGYRGFTQVETEDGTKTGWCIYKKLKMDEIPASKTKIVIWSRNRAMLDKSYWGDNTVDFILKDGENDDQLVNLTKKHLPNIEEQ